MCWLCSDSDSNKTTITNKQTQKNQNNIFFTQLKFFTIHWALDDANKLW